MINKMWKRIMAGCMVFTLAFLLPAGPLHQSEVRAATVKTGATYIAETKLYIKEKGSVEDAKKWCENQGDGWQVLDGNMNSGAAGAYSNETAVFLCYKTTTDPDEAITDLAVMNEKGNYSEGDYQRLMKEQKDKYTDMVKNMKGMLTEYRKNVEQKIPMAQRSRDILNAYKDDDSGELLGDLLLTIKDDKLAEVLLQANGIVVLTIEQQLAAACDTAKTTWLERMAKLGSFDGLKNAFSKNVKSGDVMKTLDNQYREKARLILDNWDDLHKRIEGIVDFVEKNGMAVATESQYEAWIKNMKFEDDAYASYQEFLSLTALCLYKYDGKTLYSFFKKSSDEIEREGIEVLYPMVASLSKGQLCALDESVGLFTLVQDALGANLYNDKETGKTGKAIESIKDSVDELMKSVGNGDKISIYEGVDREVFGGGVAVTNEAEDYSKGAEKAWTDAFITRGGGLSKLSIGLGIGAAGSAALATGFAMAQFVQRGKDIHFITEGLDELGAESNLVITGLWKIKGVGRAASALNNKLQEIKREVVSAAERLAAGEPGAQQAYDKAINSLNRYFKRLDNSLAKHSPKQIIFRCMKWGFTVFTILLSAADIAMTSYALYKYYHVEHMPIPHHMVNLSYSENREAAYIAYKSVRDQNDNCGDLNGGSCKQWLALYATKDKRAGEPILAPSDDKKMVVKTGSEVLPDSSCTPLHMFGTPNVPQNLTFADGDNGWSYNDKNKGTYLFFVRSAPSH